MEMLMKWLEPTIKVRIEEVDIETDHDAQFIQSKNEFYTRFYSLKQFIPQEHVKEFMDLEFYMSQAMLRISERTYRAGLADGMKLDREIQSLIAPQIESGVA